MKKLKFSLAALFAAALIATGCSGASDSKAKDEKNAEANAEKTVDTSVPVPTAANADLIVLNVRYYSVDSVFANYKMAQDLNSELEKKGKSYQSRIQQLQNEIGKLESNIQTKMNNNTYLSQESYEADVKEYQTKGQQAGNEISKMENELANLQMQSAIKVNDALNNFLKAYATQNGFNAIIPMPNPGYVDPALDVTLDIITGLNAQYK